MRKDTCIKASLQCLVVKIQELYIACQIIELPYLTLPYLMLCWGFPEALQLLAGGQPCQPRQPCISRFHSGTSLPYSGQLGTFASARVSPILNVLAISPSFLLSPTIFFIALLLYLPAILPAARLAYDSLSSPRQNFQYIFNSPSQAQRSIARKGKHSHLREKLNLRSTTKMTCLSS